RTRCRNRDSAGQGAPPARDPFANRPTTLEGSEGVDPDLLLLHVDNAFADDLFADHLGGLRLVRNDPHRLGFGIVKGPLGALFLNALLRTVCVSLNGALTTAVGIRHPARYDDVVALLLLC